MRNAAVFAGCLLASLAFVAALGAQPIPQSSIRPLPGAEQRTRPFAVQVDRPASVLALGGLAGAGAGVLAGGLLGGTLAFAAIRCDDQDGCGGEYAVWAFNGAAAGMSALTPLGVHLANRRQGRYTPTLLASAGIGGLGLGVFWIVQQAEGPDAFMAAAIIGTPIIQILSSTAIERMTSRRRH